MAELPKIPDTEHNEPVVEEVPVPSSEELDPKMIVTTKRESPIIRYNVTPLTETHGMTTEANRFRES